MSSSVGSHTVVSYAAHATGLVAKAGVLSKSLWIANASNLVTVPVVTSVVRATFGASLNPVVTGVIVVFSSETLDKMVVNQVAQEAYNAGSGAICSLAGNIFKSSQSKSQVVLPKEAVELKTVASITDDYVLV